LNETKANGIGESANKVKIIQVAIIVIVAVVFFFLLGQWYSLSALFGGGVALTYTLLLGWNVSFAASKEGYEQQALYLGAVVRFIIVTLLLIVGLGLIKFNAMAAVISFCLAQIAYVISLGISVLNKKKEE